MPKVLDQNAAGSIDPSRPSRFLVSFESKPVSQILLILLAAAVLCLPCLFYGLPSGANAPTHVRYQHHFSHQFWNGEGYPRWLAEANKGYGSPIFVVQYPLPYFVTALLNPITSFPSASRETRELGLFVFLALAGAGLASWFWFRQFTRPLAATLAAMVYMAMPFIMQDGIYARTAIGELCTFIWMPLALSMCESMYVKRSAVFVLSGAFALLIASNLLAAVLFAPVLTIYAIFCGKPTEPSIYRRGVLVLFAQFLGAGMAAVYLVPLVAYRRLFDVHQMEAHLPGYQMGLYFLNIASTDLSTRVIDIAIGGALLFAGAAAWYIWHVVEDARVRIGMAVTLIFGMLTLIPNLGPTIVHLSGFELRPAPPNDFTARTFLGLFFTIALGFLAYCRIAGRSGLHRGMLLLSIAAVSFFMMLPFSAPIWKLTPGSSNIQFPYRFGGIMCIAVAGIISMAFDSCLQSSGGSRRRPSRLVIALAAFAAIAGGFLTWRTDLRFFHPGVVEFNVTQDVDHMFRTYVSPERLPAFAKAVGATPDGYEVEPTRGDGVFRYGLINGDCDVNVRRERPRELFVSTNCREEGRLRIGQVYSPLWSIVPLQASPQNPVVSTSAEGLIELMLSPGKQDIRLVFDMGRPERWGTILSGASLLIGLLGFVYFRIRPTQVPGRLVA